MKIYIAGKLRDETERTRLEKIESICKELGFDTFLPHRDVGLAESIKDAQKMFEGDILKGFREIGLLIADLDGLHIGAGTAWEMGYAYALNIPVIGLKTDEPLEEAFEYLSSILICSMDLACSLDELKNKLSKFNKNK